MSYNEIGADPDMEALRSLLEPDETLRQAGKVGVAYGDPGPVADQSPVELTPPRPLRRLWAFATRTALRKVVFFTLLAPLMLYAALGSGTDHWIERLIGGVSCTGARDSIARRLQRSLNAPFSGADTMIVSDKRLILVRRGITRDPSRTTLVTSVELDDLAGADVRPRGLLRRRVEARFTDTSSIVLALPMLRSPSPKRTVAALTGSQR